jgi:hypothetical protein
MGVGCFDGVGIQKWEVTGVGATTAAAPGSVPPVYVQKQRVFWAVLCPRMAVYNVIGTAALDRLLVECIRQVQALRVLYV